jgi:hypothetical protein
MAVRGNRRAVRGNRRAVRGNRRAVRGNRRAVRGNRRAVRGNNLCRFLRLVFIVFALKYHKIHSQKYIVSMEYCKRHVFRFHGVL